MAKHRKEYITDVTYSQEGFRQHSQRQITLLKQFSLSRLLKLHILNHLKWLFSNLAAL